MFNRSAIPVISSIWRRNELLAHLTITLLWDHQKYVCSPPTLLKRNTFGYTLTVSRTLSMFDHYHIWFWYCKWTQGIKSGLHVMNYSSLFSTHLYPSKLLLWLWVYCELFKYDAIITCTCMCVWAAYYLPEPSFSSYIFHPISLTTFIIPWSSHCSFEQHVLHTCIVSDTLLFRSLAIEFITISPSNIR